MSNYFNLGFGYSRYSDPYSSSHGSLYYRESSHPRLNHKDIILKYLETKEKLPEGINTDRLSVLESRNPNMILDLLNNSEIQELFFTPSTQQLSYTCKSKLGKILDGIYGLKKQEIAEFYLALLPIDQALLIIRESRWEQSQLIGFIQFLRKEQGASFEMLKPLFEKCTYFSDAADLFQEVEWSQSEIKEFISFSKDTRKWMDPPVPCPVEQARHRIICRFQPILERIDSLEERYLAFIKLYTIPSTDRHILQRVLPPLFLKMQWSDEQKHSFILHSLQFYQGDIDTFVDHFITLDIADHELKNSALEHLQTACNSQNKSQIFILRFKEFKVESEERRVAHLLSLVSSEKLGKNLAARNSENGIRCFENFEVSDEEAKTEILLAIIANGLGQHVLDRFETFGIRDDRNKEKILVAIFQSENTIKWANLKSLNFSSRLNEREAFRLAIQPLFRSEFSFMTSRSPSIAQQKKMEELISSLQDPRLIQVVLEEWVLNCFDAHENIQELCINPIGLIPDEFSRLNSLKWLAKKLSYFSGSSGFQEILSDPRLLKRVTAIMLIPSPNLREAVFKTWIKHCQSPMGTELFRKREAQKAELPKKEITPLSFSSVFLQPLDHFLRSSQAPQEAVKALRKVISSYRSNPTAFSALPDLSLFPDEEQQAIERLFESYLAYCALPHSEKFDAQFQSSLLKAAHSNQKFDRAKMKRELWWAVGSFSRFQGWLSTFELTRESKEAILNLYIAYSFKSEKIDREFVEMYADLLGQDFPSGQVPPGLVEAIHSNLQQDNYLPTLQMLERLLNSTKVIEPKHKAFVIEKLMVIFKNREEIRPEVFSLIAILQLIDHFPIPPDRLLAENSFSSTASTLIQELFDLGEDPNLVANFERHFLSARFEGLFGAYYAKIQNGVHAKEADQAMKKIVSSVLHETLMEDRLSSKHSPTMARLETEYPEVYLALKKLQYSRPIYLDGKAPAAPFSPHKWLWQKLAVDRHLDLSHFRNLQAVLENLDAPIEAASSEVNLEARLILFARAQTKEEQISHLRELQQYSVGDDFANDVRGALHLLTQEENQGFNYVARIGSSFPDFMLAGTYVSGSCQTMLNGDPALMGFLDGKYIPLLIEEFGAINPCARAFLKIDFDEETKKPQLFLERFYTSNNHPDFPCEIEKSAREISKLLGLPVPIVKDDGSTPYTKGKNFNGCLESMANGWSFMEYSDAGKGRKEGSYTYGSDSFGSLRFLHEPA